MFSSTIHLLFACIFLPLITATSLPLCMSDSNISSKFRIDTAIGYYNSFCAQLAAHNFTSTTSNSNSSISLVYVAGGPSDCSGNLTADSCESIYETLLSDCSEDNNTLQGAGSVDTGCGVYNFSLESDVSSNTSTNATGSGAGASGVNRCIFTGSLLVGVAAIFGWFL